MTNSLKLSSVLHNNIVVQIERVHFKLLTLTRIHLKLIIIKTIKFKIKRLQDVAIF